MSNFDGSTAAIRLRNSRGGGRESTDLNKFSYSE
jgi:hypothetical protein